MMRTRTIGFVSPELGGHAMGPVITEVHAVARRRGARLIAFRATPRDISDIALAYDHVDGWLVTMNTDGIEELARAGKPIVTVAASAPGFPAVRPDNRGGVCDAVRHLIAHGHRRIAFIGYSPFPDLLARYEAYRDTLAEHDIPLDPDLVFEIPAWILSEAWIVGRRLIELGMPCTALVAGADMLAIGVMETVQEAGYRVPEDLAIIGFDDTHEARHTTPPLSTVRLPFADLGGVAARLLLDRLDGQDVPAEIIYVPTPLVLRHSCGCSIALSHRAAGVSGDGWREALAREAVTLLLAPLPLDPATPPEQVWPGVTTLLQTLDAALDDTVGPPASDLESAWHAAIAFTSELNILLATARLFEGAGARRLAEQPGNTAATRITAASERIMQALFQARLNEEIARRSYLEHMLQNNEAITVEVLGADTGQEMRLAWMARTTAQWGCLGLWAGDEPNAAATLTIAGAYSRDGANLVPLKGQYSPAAFPPDDYFPVATHAAGDSIIALFLLKTERHDWGVLALARPTDARLAYYHDNIGVWSQLFSAAFERRALLQSLAQQQDDLQIAYDRESALARTVRELGCPVIPLREGVLLVPLIGAIDSNRAQQIISAMLEGVNSYQARTVLLDVTGVPLVDTQVANALLEATRAVTLLGARVIMVGVRPEIAQSIVGLGLDLRAIATQPTLAAALRALRG